jgi:hypothetical protein
MEGDDLHARISAAHAETLQVGDSPTRADGLAEKLPELAGLLKRSSLSSDLQPYTVSSRPRSSAPRADPAAGPRPL